MSSRYNIALGRDRWGYSTSGRNTIQDQWGYAVAIGQNASVDNTNSIAIGYEAVATNNAISIGHGVNTNVASTDNAIQIGSRDTTDNEIYLSNLDIRDMEARISQLEDIIKKQQETIEAMWYAPGMPGYQEGKEMWNADTNCDDDEGDP